MARAGDFNNSNDLEGGLQQLGSAPGLSPQMQVRRLADLGTQRVRGHTGLTTLWLVVSGALQFLVLEHLRLQEYHASGHAPLLLY